MTEANIQRFLNEWAPRKEILASETKNKDGDTTATAATTPTWSSCLLVVSSASGYGKAARLAPKIARSLSQSGYQRVVVVPTKHKGHAMEIFREEPDLSSRYDVAIVLGGDGALSEALNGMLSRTDRARVPLAHCPGGSVSAICGNTLGMWNNIEDDDEIRDFCKFIGTRKLSKIDVNRITCSDGVVRYSSLVMSGGNNTDIVRLSNDYRWTHSWFGPTFRYVLGFLFALLKYGHRDTNRRLKITINEEESFELPAFGFSLYNCGRTTQGMPLSDATLDSGTLGFVVAMRYLGFRDHLKFMKSVKENATKDGVSIPNLYSRNDIRSITIEPVVVEAAAKASTTTTTVSSQQPRPCYLGFDGEMIDGSDGRLLTAPFSAMVLPKELEIVVA